VISFTPPARRYPQAKRVRVIGGLDPSPFNGIARGLGLAVQSGKMTVDEAVGFLADLLDNRVGTAKGWRHAMGGMLGQIGRGESAAGEMVNFLVSSAFRRTAAYHGGLLARVTGTRNGIPAVVIRRAPTSGPGSCLMRNMAAITGTACAAFMVLALDENGTRTGAFAPEVWAEPQAFYKALERVGTPCAEVVESVK